ncbi:hypothetical protein [Vibrio sp. 1F255]|uniref:hypothetical protein n=1 Tax=Vibrio sp. 1F255 TaxID=3230009 RepID=UPI00352E309F
MFNLFINNTSYIETILDEDDINRLFIPHHFSKLHSIKSKLNGIIEILEDLDDIKTVERITLNLQEHWKRFVSPYGLEDYLNIQDKEQCEWAIESLKKNQFISEISNIFIPTDDLDYYFFSLAIFDLIDNKRDKELLLLKMRKAWTQKKYRSKENGKRAYSISLSPDTKDKLDKIVDLKDGKICNAIERLVSEEYDKLHR